MIRIKITLLLLIFNLSFPDKSSMLEQIYCDQIIPARK